ncbi:MAG: DUF4861 domain-containing protein [Prevotella sp.]|nr:DUF4861 domain-containing protein [Prevotella sp.]
MKKIKLLKNQIPMKKALICFALSAVAIIASGQKTLEVMVENPSSTQKMDAPVVLKLDSYGMDVKSALVSLDGKEIPCQLDDINMDEKMDELCFLADIDKKTTNKYIVTLYDTGTQKEYTPRVFAELLIRNNKVKEANKQDLFVSSLIVEKGVNPYSMIHHHGIAFESELTAFRVYFDNRQTVDLYGKFNKQLELQQTQFYPSEEQKAEGFGDDVLWVGATFGLGALRGWDGSKQTMLDDVFRRGQRVVSTGPLRAIVQIMDYGWVPKEGDEPIDMIETYTIYGGDRACDVDIKFGKPASGYLFATGLVNVKNSQEFSDKDGLRGCWGTDWPAGEPKETSPATYKQETVGLGIYVPREYIASEEAANKDEYTYVVKTDTDNLHYKITFASDNENFGYHSEKEWFDYLKAWKQNIEEPLKVSVTEK